MSPSRLVLALLVTSACGGGESAPAPKSLEEQAAERCPRVHMDRLAGDWVLASGDVKVRMRVVERGGETLLWYLDPAYSNHRLELVGTKRDKDWQFDERPTGKRAKLIEAGGEARKRVYVAPRLKTCRLEVYPGAVDASGAEAMPPKPREFAEFPADTQGVVFSFAPFAEPLFVGAAAKDKATADKQLAEQGEPDPLTDMGSVAVSGWSSVEADGDPACSYTYEAFFDGRKVGEGEAQAPVDGTRPWTHTFEAPWSGNHELELQRFRTCGGAREALPVMGLLAILQ